MEQQFSVTLVSDKLPSCEPKTEQTGSLHICVMEIPIYWLYHICVYCTRSWDSWRHPGTVYRVKLMVEPFVLGTLGGTSVAAPCWRPTRSHPHQNKGVDYSWPCLWTLLSKLPPHLHVSRSKLCLKNERIMVQFWWYSFFIMIIPKYFKAQTNIHCILLTSIDLCV